ncbi:MAG: type II toxin-antitoxin system VapC family toxin [Deltaproteobacteria bacterium]|nr:type II toxin-antitoxin system VapC family toxin [Deltaproteobacteria bacterium]
MLDASIVVAGVRAGEPGHRAARPLLVRALTGADEIVVPAIFPIEVASALVRRGLDGRDVRKLVASLRSTATEIVAITGRRVSAITEVALACRLRAADAAYVWLAEDRGLPLYTLDDEMLARGSSRCSVVRP